MVEVERGNGFACRTKVAKDRGSVGNESGVRLLKAVHGVDEKLRDSGWNKFVRVES